MRLKWEQLTVGGDEEDSSSLRWGRGAASTCSSSAPAAPPAPGTRRVLHHLVAGALAGATAKTIEAPLDRVKIIFQVSKQRFSLRAAALKVAALAKSEGLQGLWKGNGACAACAAGARQQQRRKALSVLQTSTHTALSRRHDVPRCALRCDQLHRTRDAESGALCFARGVHSVSVERIALSVGLPGPASSLCGRPAPQWLTPKGETRRGPLRKFVAGALTGMTSTICTYVCFPPLPYCRTTH